MYFTISIFQIKNKTQIQNTMLQIIAYDIKLHLCILNTYFKYMYMKYWAAIRLPINVSYQLAYVVPFPRQTAISVHPRVFNNPAEQVPLEIG